MAGGSRDHRVGDAAPGIARGAATALLAGEAMNAEAAAVEDVEDIDEKRAGWTADSRDIAPDFVHRRRIVFRDDGDLAGLGLLVERGRKRRKEVSRAARDLGKGEARGLALDGRGLHLD